MKEDPLDAVYSYVERAYIRLQAGDVLIRCLDESSAAPMHQLVEGLILAGPQSMAVLQEILAETGHRKNQVMDDLHQIFSELEANLKSYGVELTGVGDKVSVSEISSAAFIRILLEQQVIEEEAQNVCLQLLENSKELMRSLAMHIQLLEEIETYLQDWLWGLAYQSARQRLDDSSSSLSKSL